MSEVHRYQVVTVLSMAGATIGYDPHGPDVVMASDFDNATRLFLDAAERCIASERREKELQQRLTAADERADLLNDLLLRTIAYYTESCFPEDLLLEVKAALKVVSLDRTGPTAVVPDGYCIMPRRLTAENGAKALLLGEFKLKATQECPECRELEEPMEGCEICDGEGEYGQQYTISWDQIKFIYSKAVSGLAMKAESAKSR